MSIPIACRCGGKKIEGICDRCGQGKPKHDRTTKQRGYDSKWKRLSRMVRKEIPVCVPCWNDGDARPADACHHIVKVKDAPHMKHDRDNVLPVCETCHAVLDALYERDRAKYDELIETLRATMAEIAEEG